LLCSVKILRPPSMISLTSAVSAIPSRTLGFCCIPSRTRKAIGCPGCCLVEELPDQRFLAKHLLIEIAGTVLEGPKG